MSSKVHHGDAEDVSAMVWQTVNLHPAAPARNPMASPGGPPRSADGSEEASLLRARVGQMEQAHAQELAAARARGFQEGEAAGRTQGAVSVQPVIERMCRSIQEMTELRTRLRRDAEADVVRLALAIARRVLHRELSLDPDALRGLVKVSLENLAGQEVYRVRVHPSQAELVRQWLEKLTTRKIEVVGDGSGQPGMLVFETNRCKLDASLDSQLTEIERGLTDRVNH